jgi:hypothetical protein
MRARVSQLAFLIVALSACRHSSYEFASSTVARYGPELERAAADLSECPAGAYVDGVEHYGSIGKQCILGAKSGTVRSVLLSAGIYWVVIGGEREPTLLVIRDRRRLSYGPIGVLYYTAQPWSKQEIEKTGHIAIGNCPCKWFYQDS